MLKDSFNFGPHACLVFDLLGKSLATFLRENHARPFPPRQLQHISRQLFSGVVCGYKIGFMTPWLLTDLLVVLHQSGVIHTDLKPDNILLVSDDYDEIAVMKVRLSAFSAFAASKLKGWLAEPRTR